MLVSITPVASPTITGLTGTVSLGILNLNWTTVTDPNFRAARVYSGTTNVFTSATPGSEIASNFANVILTTTTQYFWVRAVDIYGRTTGTIAGPIVATKAGILAGDIPAGVITADKTNIAAINSTTGAINANAVAIANFASGIEPVGVVTTLPSGAGYTGPKVVLLTTDSKLYRNTSSTSTPTWIAAISATDVSGTLSLGQIPQIPTSQLSGTISTGQIQANSIGAGQIATNYVYAGAITANQITTGTLSAGIISGGQLSGVNVGIGSGQFGGYSFRVFNNATYASFLYSGTFICDNSSSTASSTINAQSVSSTDTITVSNNYSGNALNVTVGKTNLAGTLAIGGQTTSKAITPSTDNASVCGYTGQAWNNVFSYIYTTVSDRRAKTDIADIAYGLNFIKSLRPVSYKMAVGLNTEVEVAPAVYDSKGVELSKRVVRVDSQPGVRTHFGLIAQEVKTAVGGLDSALWVLADKNDPNSDQALRYDGFIAPLIKAVQELSDRLDKLEKGRPA